MSRIVICVALLTVFVAHANAQESRGKVSVGLAFSGPTYGVSVRTKFTNRFNGRLIYLVDEWFQAQIQFKPNALNNTHYIFGAGRLAGDDYILRGAIGKDWFNQGPLSITADLGLNIPIVDSDESSGLADIGAAIAALIVLGIGVHYEFR